LSAAFGGQDNDSNIIGDDEGLPDNNGGDDGETNNNSLTVALSPPPGNAEPSVSLVSAPGTAENAGNNLG
jgi:hypothetical protein